MPSFYDTAGYVSAATLGYIHGNTRGAIKGVRAYNSLKRSRESSISNEMAQKKPKLEPPGKSAPGSGFSYPKNKMVRRTTKKTYKKNTKNIKKTILSMASTKHLAIDNNNCQVTIAKQNQVYSNCITAQLVQGNADNNRLGDEITLSELLVRGYYFTDSNSGAYQGRVLVGYSGLEHNNSMGPIPFAGSIPATDIFLPGTIGGNTVQAIVNPKVFTVLYDESFTVNSMIASVADMYSFERKIRLSGKFPYRSPGNVFGKYRNLYIVFVGFKAGGTPGDTNIGTFAASYDLKFKDM